MVLVGCSNTLTEPAYPQAPRAPVSTTKQINLKDNEYVWVDDKHYWDKSTSINGHKYLVLYSRTYMGSYVGSPIHDPECPLENPLAKKK